MALAYADQSDLAQVGVRADVTSGVDSTTLDGILMKRSRFADGYLAASGRYILPISAWGDDLRLAVCELSAYDALTAVIGMNPDDSANSNWIERKNDAMQWLRDVAAGKVVPVGIVDSTPSTSEGGASVSTDCRRGW
jgi:phage gp36-like protein